jgi:anhydro-N-acetylmuramic acid kinase
MNPILKILGMMSGTSLDGLDIALVEVYETRGSFKVKNQYFKTYPYDENIREKLLKNINPETSKLDSLCELNFVLGDLWAENIRQFCSEFKISLSDIDLIGTHGQTFYHYVENNIASSTLQLGEPAVISLKTGITTIGDFRPFDIAVGGQGAPLVPFADYLLFSSYNKSFALQNIGGIANFTYIPADKNIEKLVAFDTGPGNMIIDSMVKKLSGGKLNYDDQGQWAAKGQVNSALLAELLNNNYFKLSPPKSTGRELFGEQFSLALYEKAQKNNIGPEDLLATVTQFVAQTIFESYKNFLTDFPDEIVISGGGARNLTLLHNLRQLLPPSTNLTTLESYGIMSDAKEAVAFAIFAYCTVFGIPNNLPAATGASESVVMGKICPGKNYKSVLLKKNRNGYEPFPTKESSQQEITESNNLLSQDLDQLTPVEIVELMNKADFTVLEAIDNVKEDIAAVMTKIIASLADGGKLFYTGAGTSGRLGVLDASECPPTFKTAPELVQGIIAGGEKALTRAIEGAEDSGEQGRNDIRAKISGKDILIGISANGKAPYVIEALEEAKKAGAGTALITCNNIGKHPFIDNIIILDVGPEILSGSTRLKAGTATKMVLNMFTTGAFAKLGKVYGNYMVDLKVSNNKLKKRAVNIIMALTGSTEEQASVVLEKAEGSVKLALLMQMKKIGISEAKPLLEKHKGFLRKALSS